MCGTLYYTCRLGVTSLKGNRSSSFNGHGVDSLQASGFGMGLGLSLVAGCDDRQSHCAHERHSFKKYDSHAHMGRVPQLRSVENNAIGSVHRVSDIALYRWSLGRLIVMNVRMCTPTANSRVHIMTFGF